MPAFKPVPLRGTIMEQATRHQSNGGGGAGDASDRLRLDHVESRLSRIERYLNLPAIEPPRETRAPLARAAVARAEAAADRLGALIQARNDARRRGAEPIQPPPPLRATSPSTAQ